MVQSRRTPKCPFYQSTRDGYRCVLLPPEEWRMLKRRLIDYCYEDHRRCPIYVEKYEKPRTSTLLQKHIRIFYEER